MCVFCRCKKSTASLESLKLSRDILLAVMSHDIESVRLRAYYDIYNIVKVLAVYLS